jgi:hypothetical protein
MTPCSLSLNIITPPLSRFCVIAFSALFVFGCQKKQDNALSSPLLPVIESARSYFNGSVLSSATSPNAANFRAQLPKTVRWDLATSTQLSAQSAIIAPIQFTGKVYVSADLAAGRLFDLNSLTRLVLTRDSTNSFHYQLLTYIPDSTAIVTQTYTSGILLSEDWQGNSLSSPRRFARKPLAATSGNKHTDVIQTIQVCNTIDGYNYSPDDPDGGLTSWSETSCNSYNLPANNTGPTIGPANLAGILGPKPIPFTIQVSPPTSPIASISDYFKCFTNGSSPDHTYSAQVCVDQPSSGTRQPWTVTPGGAAGTSAVGNPLNVGHTFLVLTENDQGNITTRNVGFYPATSVYPVAGYTSAQGVLNDDDGHPYNISLTINVSATQFFGILNYVSLGNNPGFNYDLNTDNCTTFVINALGANGIALPNTKGTWATGSGNDPGDLGQDISQMQLAPNMTRNTVSSPHPNAGTCN